MSGTPPYINSKISLISKAGIRYEGILYAIDTKESTVSLSKVRLFGTENRAVDRIVQPREEVYEYIIFRGSDIQDLQVCEPPQSEQSHLLNQDPAIVTISQNAPKLGLPTVAQYMPEANSGSTTSAPVQTRTRVPPQSLGINKGGSGVIVGRGFQNSSIGSPTPLIMPDELPQSRSDVREHPYSAPYKNASMGPKSARYPHSAGFSGKNQSVSPNYYSGGANFAAYDAGYGYYGRQDHSYYGRHEYTDYNYPGLSNYRSHHQQFNVDHSNRNPVSRTSQSNAPLKSATSDGNLQNGRNMRIGNTDNYDNRPFSGNRNIVYRRTGRGAQTTNNMQSSKKQFNSDYDFESANAKIAEEFSKMFLDKKTVQEDNTETKSENDIEEMDKLGDIDSDESHHSDNTASQKTSQAPFYNKQKSFFDFIGSESVDRANGIRVNQLNRKDEKILNEETFGGSSRFNRNFKPRNNSTGDYRSFGYRANPRYENNWHYRQYAH